MKKNVAVGLIVLAWAGDAAAQAAYVRAPYTYPLTPSGSGPASVQVPNTPLYVTPYIGFGAGYDDNLFMSNTNHRDSALYVLSPGLKVDARSSNQVFQLSYQGQAGHYTDSENDNYVDHTFRGQYDIAFDRRNFLKLGYDYIRGHDPRGSTDRPLSLHPDRYELSSPSITYAFGTPGAQGRVEAYGSYGRKRYLNNPETTFASDRDTTEFGGAFYWRVAPKTYALVEARQTQLKYVQPGSRFSADETRLYGGISWEATAATTGTIKVGQLKRDFVTDQPNFTDTSWEALITWAPRTYSKLDFYTARLTNESTGQGSFILSTVAGVAWTHAWSSVFNTGLDLRYQKDEYQGFNRNDEIKSLGFKVGYKFRRWLTIGGEYTYTQRDSNQRIFEYDRNFYLLTATASM